MWQIEEGAVLDGKERGDGFQTPDVAVYGDEVEEAVRGEGGGEDGRPFGHDGHVAAVEVTEGGVGEEGPAWGEGGGDCAVLEGGEGGGRRGG